MNNSIYLLEPDPEKYLWLTLHNEADSKLLEPISEAKPVAASWKPVTVEPIVEDADDRYKVLSDFPAFWTHPVMSKKAIVALRDFLNENTELLPVTGKPYHIVNVTRLLDVLDEDKSQLQRFASSNDIMHISEYWFKENRLDNVPIFRLPQYRSVEVFVNHEFRERVDNAGLTGFVFKQVWPHNIDTKG